MESRLIDEDNGIALFFSLFLSSATGIAANGRSLLHPDRVVAELVFAASN
jgi:hypothetical protein